MCDVQDMFSSTARRLPFEPDSDEGRSAQRQKRFLHHPVWDCWRRYFRYRGVVPAAPLTTDPNKHFIFVHVPHAVFP